MVLEKSNLNPFLNNLRLDIKTYLPMLKILNE